MWTGAPLLAMHIRQKTNCAQRGCCPRADGCPDGLMPCCTPDQMATPAPTRREQSAAGLQRLINPAIVLHRADQGRWRPRRLREHHRPDRMRGRDFARTAPVSSRYSNSRSATSTGTEASPEESGAPVAAQRERLRAAAQACQGHWRYSFGLPEQQKGRGWGASLTVSKSKHRSMMPARACRRVFLPLRL